MNRSLWKQIAVRGLAWMAAVAVCSAVALAQDAAPASAQRSDGQIEMDVVHALDGSQALKSDLITAATIQSKVTLSGTVSTEDSKKLAESIVRGVPGVTGVVNNLKVGDPAQDPNAQAAQADASQEQMPDSQRPANDQAQQQYPAQQYPAQQPQSNQQPQYSQPQQYPAQQQPQYPAQQPQYPPPPPQYGQPAYGQQAPPPPPPGYGNGYGQPQYAQQPPYTFSHKPVTVPVGSLIQLRTSEAVDSKRAQEGQPVQFVVVQDVTFGGILAIPRGATVHGVVTAVKRTGSGSLTGSSELALQLTSLEQSGQSYPIQSDQFKVKSPGKGEHTAENIIGGSMIGALIGAAAGGRGSRGMDAGIGAGAGAAAGTAASAASSGPNVWIPAEALVTFHLTAPVTVNPVGPQEAARLAQGLNPGGPNLYRRGYYGRPYPPPYPYYGPVYYRPYYVVGGAYYWR